MARPHSQHWWQYVPPAERRSRSWMLRRLRWSNRLRSRRFWLIGSLMIYVIGCSALLAFFPPSLALLALAPLLLLPMLGYLVYWLIWKEFHE
ncbi:hypothetical protein [Synechococcus sp. CCY9202]|uniref:hypothetical protein n=1 Tax=Synechococcus sp. CCY9202 TaxID=174698 RepID=UPI002B21BAF9|nr:hypothetical protein [Synechococcus sp. CCY9202]MEA5423974.1 hypothetical protein [Synechococcus sp. CCY9202]